MKAHFHLLPVAALTIAVPAHATVYLTVEQAQALMFPGASFTPAFLTLTDAQVAAIEAASDTSVRDRNVRAWRASSGGWFIADEVIGKHDYIPFAVAIDADGAVKSVEILEYREAYGGEVHNPKWLAQFAGKKEGNALADGESIKNISGATLSSKHVTDGVRRLLATYAIVLAGH
jgi:Na+-translocating ferredoxin:NAD+ oxidoreductase RnfG subunit